MWLIQEKPNDSSLRVEEMKIKFLAVVQEAENYGRRFVTLYRKQESRPTPRKRNAKKQNGCLKKGHKKKRRDKVLILSK